MAGQLASMSVGAGALVSLPQRGVAGLCPRGVEHVHVHGDGARRARVRIKPAHRHVRAAALRPLRHALPPVHTHKAPRWRRCRLRPPRRVGGRVDGHQARREARREGLAAPLWGGRHAEQLSAQGCVQHAEESRVGGAGTRRPRLRTPARHQHARRLPAAYVVRHGRSDGRVGAQDAQQRVPRRPRTFAGGGLRRCGTARSRSVVPRRRALEDGRRRRGDQRQADGGRTRTPRRVGAGGRTP